jgi:hypothetical protein
MTADTIIRITSRGREWSALDPAAVPNGRVVEMLLDSVHNQNRADARVQQPDPPHTANGPHGAWVAAHDEQQADRTASNSPAHHQQHRVQPSRHQRVTRPSRQSQVDSGRPHAQQAGPVRRRAGLIAAAARGTTGMQMCDV